MDASLQVLMRETPLEVLTRAASLVAGCETIASTGTGKKSLKRTSAESDVQTNIAMRNSSSKCRRLCEQGTAIQTAFEGDDDEDDDDDDKAQSDEGGRRSASTQTAFSSFVPFSEFCQLQQTNSVLPDPIPDEEPCLILDLDKQTVKPSHSCHILSATSSAKTRDVEFESNSVPLNLTVSIPSRSPTGSYPQMTSFSWPMSSCSRSSCQPVSKPSASSSDYDVSMTTNWKSEKSRQYINCIKMEPTSFPRNVSGCHESGTNSLGNGTIVRKPEQVDASTCSYMTVKRYPTIDEHFRRSLGNNYSRVIPRDASASSTVYQSGVPRSHCLANTTPPRFETPSSLGHRSVTGAVDEHFAKSLGSTWTKIKSESATSSIPTRNSSAVDDHFAKALGETWYKLKAEKRSA